MMLTEMQINDDIIKRFVELNKKQRLAHAYLFVGAQDVGKFDTALGVAKVLNCRGNNIIIFVNKYKNQNETKTTQNRKLKTEISNFAKNNKRRKTHRIKNIH